MKSIVLFSFSLLIAFSGFSQKCLNKSKFKDLAEYIVKNGYAQNSNAAPYPVTYHFTDEKHHMEFEHTSYFHQNKELKKEKVWIKKKEDLEYTYYVVMEGKKLYLEDHAHSKHTTDHYAEHFCELIERMGF